MAISGELGPEVGVSPGGGEEDVASIAISGEPGPEVGEPPGGGEDDVVSMAISDEPGPEVSEPPLAWPPLSVSSFCQQRHPLLATSAHWRLLHVSGLGSHRNAPNRIAQGQQGRS